MAEEKRSKRRRQASDAGDESEKDEDVINILKAHKTNDWSLNGYPQLLYNSIWCNDPALYEKYSETFKKVALKISHEQRFETIYPNNPHSLLTVISPYTINGDASSGLSRTTNNDIALHAPQHFNLELFLLYCDVWLQDGSTNESLRSVPNRLSINYATCLILTLMVSLLSFPLFTRSDYAL